MKLREAVRLALAALWANRLRSVLTVLGNVVAVLSVITVVSVLQGLDRFVAQEFLATGSHVFSLTKFGLITDWEQYLQAAKRRDLTVEDAEALQRQLTLAEVVVPRRSERMVIKRGRRSAGDAPVFGVGAGYPLVGDFPLAAGRHLEEVDLRARADVAVVGDGIREKLFLGEDPLGKDVRIGGRRYTIVGLLQHRGGSMGLSRDDEIFVPVTALQKQVSGRSSIDIMVKARAPEEFEAAQEEASLHLKIRRGLNPWDKPDFDVMTDEQLYALYQNATRGIYGLLVGIVSLSLLIGGIVIMNIMLVSVTERTREIGIRKAVGARRVDIVRQFMVESVVLAFAGGVFGVGLGITAALAVRAFTPLPASVQLWSVLVGLLLASSVGIFFGIYPAHRASRLEPIAALRQET